MLRWQYALIDENEQKLNPNDFGNNQKILDGNNFSLG